MGNSWLMALVEDKEQERKEDKVGENQEKMKREERKKNHTEKETRMMKRRREIGENIVMRWVISGNDARTN